MSTFFVYYRCYDGVFQNSQSFRDCRVSPEGDFIFLRFAAGAPISGGGVKTMIGRFAIMISHSFAGSFMAFPGSIAHCASETQKNRRPFFPGCSWHLLPKAVLVALKKACMPCLAFALMSGRHTSVI